MEWKDPIVDEVRKIREQLLEKHGGFNGFISYLKKMEEKHKERVAKPKEDQIMLKHD